MDGYIENEIGRYQKDGNLRVCLRSIVNLIMNAKQRGIDGLIYRHMDAGQIDQHMDGNSRQTKGCTDLLINGDIDRHINIVVIKMSHFRVDVNICSNSRFIYLQFSV